MIASMPELLTNPKEGTSLVRFVSWYERVLPRGGVQRCLFFRDRAGQMLRLDSTPEWVGPYGRKVDTIDPENLSKDLEYEVTVREHRRRIGGTCFVGTVSIPKPQPRVEAATCTGGAL